MTTLMYEVYMFEIKIEIPTEPTMFLMNTSYYF